jgi:hypothetical protein
MNTRTFENGPIKTSVHLYRFKVQPLRKKKGTQRKVLPDLRHHRQSRRQGAQVPEKEGSSFSLRLNWLHWADLDALR